VREGAVGTPGKSEAQLTRVVTGNGLGNQKKETKKKKQMMGENNLNHKDASKTGVNTG